MFLLSLLLALLACPWNIWAANVAVVERQASGKVTATASNSINTASVYSVLLTALPSSLLKLAQTNSPAFSSVIESKFANGQTPAWFTALPKDIQTYLVPVTDTSSHDATRSSLQSATRTPTTAGTKTPTIATTSAQETQPTQYSVGLSTGAKVGIGVGVPIGVIAMGAVAGAYLLGVRRGRKVNIAAGAKVIDPSDELNVSSREESPRAELPTASNIPELPANRVASPPVEGTRLPPPMTTTATAGPGSPGPHELSG